MFGFLKKKSPNELLLENIKSTVKRINRIDGGCVKVCMDFINETQRNDMFKAIGFIQSTTLKQSKTEIMYASLILLAHLRTEKINDSDGFLIQLAEGSFVLSNIIVDENEMQELMLMSASIIEKREEILEKSRSAWKEWMLRSTEDLKAVTMM
jgi:hypothetical protein